MELVSIDGPRDFVVGFERNSCERICFFCCDEGEEKPLTEVVGLCRLVVEVGLLPALLGEFPSRGLPSGLPSGGDAPVERLCGDALLLDAAVLLAVADCRIGTVLERRGPELVVTGGEGFGDIVELFTR